MGMVPGMGRLVAGLRGKRRHFNAEGAEDAEGERRGEDGLEAR